ncbi:MAG: hypothetical protein ABI321_14980 [Polyangia bacterium]
MLRAAIAATLLLAPVVANAKAKAELSYRLEEIYSTALRYVRVDRGCTITDKDPEAAFVMFECPVSDGGADKKVSRGALELFHNGPRGRDAIQLAVSLSDEPHGAELRWVELFERKLREERGAPVAAPKPAPQPQEKSPDGGMSKVNPY